MAILLITHDFGVVYEIADEVCVMENGVLVEKGDTKKVINRPEHEYTKKLLSAIPKFEKNQRPEVKDLSNILEINNLKIYYPIRSGLLKKVKSYVKAVDNVSFQLPLGKTVAVADADKLRKYLFEEFLNSPGKPIL